MRTLVIAGAHSGAGKTALVEKLLKALKGWACLKVTVLHRGICPTGKNCGACAGVEDSFCIISDKKIIAEKSKDTCRFKEAGAKKVLWLKAKPEGLKKGIKEALAQFKGAQGLIIEGTSVLKYLKPDAAIMVRRKGSILKPSARQVLKKVDLVLDV